MADPFDREILDRAQQLGLGRERQIRHFVQEQRAAVGRLELAAPAADACGGPILDAEQLRLEQRFDERGAVDRHERPVAAPTELVDLPRHELLADTDSPSSNRETRRDALDGRCSAMMGVEPMSGARRRGASRLKQSPARQRNRERSSEDEGHAELRGEAEHLKVPFTQAALRIERRLEHADGARVGGGTSRATDSGLMCRDGASPAAGSRSVTVGPARPDVASLEHAAHQRDVGGDRATA